MVEPYRILIVEDDPEHADLIRMGFRKHDEFFLDFASTGEQGLEMIRSRSYDLISVDLVLPGIGGLDVLVRIRKFDQDIPVVMVSGHGTTELAVVAFENRATKYVVKSMESFKSLPYIFENLIQEARFKANERCHENGDRAVGENPQERCRELSGRHLHPAGRRLQAGQPKAGRDLRLRGGGADGNALLASRPA